MDFYWFSTFLSQFNDGMSHYDVKKNTSESLFGLMFDWLWGHYALPIPKHFNNNSIVHLEMLNMIVAALKVWASQWPCKKLCIRCDYM